jgi:hypothetical protein
MSDTTTTTTTAARAFTIATAKALREGTKPLTATVLDRALATETSGKACLAIVCLAIRERSIVGMPDGAASIGALARRMTVETPDREKSVRSTLSKMASTVETINLARLDIEDVYRAAWLAYDSTAPGRDILEKAAAACGESTDTYQVRRATFVTACEQARQTKSDAEKARRAARPDDGTKAATDATGDADDAGSASSARDAGTRVTWAESIAIAAAAAPSACDALDLDALQAVGMHVSVLADAIADAIARKSAAADAHKRKTAARR